jgi:flagellar hook-associated protein 2
MSGGFSAGGLITGLDSNTLIRQLMALERQPITRLNTRITALQSQRDAIRGLRTTLTTLRSRFQDFRLSGVFSAFKAASSEEKTLTAAIGFSNPVVGSFEVNVTQLASATVGQSSAVMGAAIAPGAALDSSGLTTAIQAGTFSINGVQFTVDPATDSLDTILANITASAAGVAASYDAGTDSVIIENTAPGDTSVINFGAQGDTSNFLSAIAVTGATQSTGGSGSTTVSSTRHLGALDTTKTLSAASFANGAVTAGSFSINGVSISVDPDADSIIEVIERINSSDANVTASYDANSDTIRVVSNTLGSRGVRFGGAGDTSNFLAITNLAGATQTAGKDAQFTVNGGPVQTRNTNEVADAIGGVTLNLLSVGTSTVTVSSDDDKIVENIQALVTAYNEAVNQIRDLTANEGALRGDTGIRGISGFLQQNIFNRILSLGGDYKSLADIGFSTGKDFEASATQNLSLDADALREALRKDRANVRDLFSNSAGTGIADALFNYTDEITRVTGFLNERAKSNGTLDAQVRGLNDQIDRMEDRLAQREERLRRQFSRLEQLSAGFQNQNSALSGLRSIW